jgi:hypothetical protein
MLKGVLAITGKKALHRKDSAKSLGNFIPNSQAYSRLRLQYDPKLELFQHLDVVGNQRTGFSASQ